MVLDGIRRYRHSEKQDDFSDFVLQLCMCVYIVGTSVFSRKTQNATNCSEVLHVIVDGANQL